jgi:peptidoglycan/LPS O-acetylase OafA/YrhL
MHKNNFDFLRLCFALFVLITHSCVLSGENNDGLNSLTNGQTNFSNIGLKGFFIISGYLIFESLIRSKNWLDYFGKRFLRIFPAYIVVLIFGFLIGLFLTHQQYGQYVTSKDSWSYIYQNLPLYLPIQYTISGVFEKNIYPGAINGSIWTIPYEFLFYVVLSLGFLLRAYPKLLKLSLLLCGAWILYKLNQTRVVSEIWLSPTGFDLKKILDFGLLFLSGSLLAAFSIKEFLFKKHLAVASLVLGIVSIYFSVFSYTQYIILPLLIISFGLMSSPYIAGINQIIGDLSYAIYLFGFPVQQILMSFYTFSGLELCLLSALITICIAYFSWNYIEKPALKLKVHFS